MPAFLQKLLLLAVLATAVGCKPEIGDECQISTDCSAAGDRLCDITAPGGYCTVFNCEPGACPEDESLCVQFGGQRSPIANCEDWQSPSPYQRTFCMATCESDSDCRGGYECEDLSDPQNGWGALLIDRDRGNRACMVPLQAKTVVEGAEGAGGAFGDVCDAELPGPASQPAEQPAASAGAGQGGAGG